MKELRIKFDDESVSDYYIPEKEYGYEGVRDLMIDLIFTLSKHTPSLIEEVEMEETVVQVYCPTGEPMIEPGG